jgi:hypothetical protein
VPIAVPRRSTPAIPPAAAQQHGVVPADREAERRHGDAGDARRGGRPRADARCQPVGRIGADPVPERVARDQQAGLLVSEGEPLVEVRQERRERGVEQRLGHGAERADQDRDAQIRDPHAERL